MSAAKTDKKKAVKPATVKTKSMWDSLYQPGTLMIVALLCSSPIVYGYVLKNIPAVESFPEFMIKQEQIKLAKQPEYLPKDLITQILELGKIEIPVSIHTKGLAQQIQEAAKNHPWVLSADKVELTPGEGVTLHLTYRQPVAMIKTGSGFYPIDREGVLLPPKDFNADSIKIYPVVSNVQSLPQGPEGTHWGDLSVVGAARLAEYLHPVNRDPKDKSSDYWMGLQLEEIIIPKLDQSVIKMEEIDYQIKAQGGSVLDWGVAPGVSNNKQPAAEQKLLKMLKYFQEFGSFTAPRGPYEIDFRNWSETYRRPL